MPETPTSSTASVPKSSRAYKDLDGSYISLSSDSAFNNIFYLHLILRRSRLSPMSLARCCDFDLIPWPVRASTNSFLFLSAAHTANLLFFELWVGDTLGFHF
jgi:hypothetical protein